MLKLLQDPTENELKRFKAWQDNVINTMIHTDTSIYKHFGVAYFCEFDLFENPDNQGCGYNAYLDRLCGIDSQSDPHFSLAYNLEQQIDSAKVIDVQQHTTPPL
ncbi:[weak similarity to] NAD/FAD-binding protein-like protein [methanotrophic bacterial endosymbiont of Bathymodiolus sp.]|nr:[weak similarity to] NAD/FAD-binding protein-like protein [methanotrophic bacterial endosymbiont of Bathymodiolus sp.]